MRSVLVVALVGLTTACVSQGKFRNKAGQRPTSSDRAPTSSRPRSRSSQGELEKERSERAHAPGEARRAVEREGRAPVPGRRAGQLEDQARVGEGGAREEERRVRADGERAPRQIDAGRVELTELRGQDDRQDEGQDPLLVGLRDAREGTARTRCSRSPRCCAACEGKVIRVEGHTDNVPLGRGAYRDELGPVGLARSLAVVRFLQESGVDPTRLAAAGYGEHPADRARTTRPRGAARTAASRSCSHRERRPRRRPLPPRCEGQGAAVEVDWHFWGQGDTWLCDALDLTACTCCRVSPPPR